MSTTLPPGVVSIDMLGPRSLYVGAGIALPQESTPPVGRARPDSLAVLGAGVMGASIAAVAAAQGFRVALADSRPEAFDNIYPRLAAELSPNGEPDRRMLDALRRRVEVQAADHRVAQCNLVLETIVENLPTKRQLYARLEPQLPPDAVLASNTSSIPIADLAATLTDPGRFCGIHFFHPVRQRPLVEVIRGPQTREQTIAAAVAFARNLGKTPIVVGDGPGFLVNRMLMPYLAEGLELLLDGATLEQIDAAATRFGMALGPIRALDEIGIDTSLLAGRVFYQAFPDRAIPSPIILMLYKRKRLGRKSGAGFFLYPPELKPDEPGLPDPAVDAIVSEWARPPRRFSEEEILDRLLLPMALEATRLLEERRVTDPRVIDLGAVLGLGFPSNHGGPLCWADRIGLPRIIDKLSALAGLGPRMEPTPLLRDLAAAGRSFH